MFKLSPMLFFLSLFLVSSLAKSPIWSTLLSSTRERGSIVKLLPSYSQGLSHLIVAFESGEIVNYNVNSDRIHFLQSSAKFPANISAFGYLADLDVYYTGLSNGDIWQLETSSQVQAWTVALSNTTFAPISLILPFMNGAFFDLYFAAGNGQLLEYNAFYDFGNVVYGGITTGQPTVAVYTDQLIDGILVKHLISGYSNGAIIKTTVGDGGHPMTTILRAIGSEIQKMIVYRNQQDLLLIIGSGAPQPQISIINLLDNSIIFETDFYATAVQDLLVYSDIDRNGDYLVYGFADGTILRFDVGNLATLPIIETLATPELFGGFPITALKYNWLGDSTGVLVVATEYGTISVLLNNDTNWKFLASPLSWESPQHIIDLNFIPNADDQNILIALLDKGQIACLNSTEWTYLQSSPSQSETRFKYFWPTNQISTTKSRITATLTTPVSFNMLQAWILNMLPTVLILTSQDPSNPYPEIQLSVEGWDINSQFWRQDGQNLIVVNSLTGLTQSIYYDTCFNFLFDGFIYVWTQTQYGS